MAKTLINPCIRGFICTTAHPEGHLNRSELIACNGGPGSGARLREADGV